MESLTDALIKTTYNKLLFQHKRLNPDYVLLELSRKIGQGAQDLVKPEQWVTNGLIASGISKNKAEAHAKISLIDYRMRTGEHVIIDKGFEVSQSNLNEYLKQKLHLDQNIDKDTLIIAARLESCSLEELDQAAATPLKMARERSSSHLIANVIVNLFVESSSTYRPLGKSSVEPRGMV